jgi:prepilin-type N-terminal cleavage/methylation domain-containing protein
MKLFLKKLNIYPKKLQAKKLKSCRGFSLFELLVYITILSIVMLIIAGTFLALNRGRGSSEARAEVNSNLRFAVEKIARDLKAATSITQPSSTSTPTNTLAITVEGNSVSYSLDAGSLKKGGEAITSDKVVIESLQFTRFENTNPVLGKTIISVKVEISGRYNSTNPDEQYSASKETTISLR